MSIMERMGAAYRIKASRTTDDSGQHQVTQANTGRMGSTPEAVFGDDSGLLRDPLGGLPPKALAGPALSPPSPSRSGVVSQQQMSAGERRMASARQWLDTPRVSDPYSR